MYSSKAVRLVSFIGFSFLAYAGLAQPYDRMFILNDLITNSTAINEVVCYKPLNDVELFWPDDLLVPRNDNSYNDYLVRTSEGLFVVIEGTGRVYRVSKEADQIHFNRIDSTQYVGYSFGAHVFALNDTLFSLGGYGYWRVNGQLRYYNKSVHSWEIIPVREEVPLYPAHYPGRWLNEQNRTLHYLERYINQDFLADDNKDLLNNGLTQESRCLLFDFKTRSWSVKGNLTAEAFKAIARRPTIAALPWGELISTNFAYTPAFLLFNYEENAIYKLSEQKTQSVNRILWNANKKSNKRSYLYFRNDTLHIVTTEREKLKLPLTPADFRPTGQAIYQPIKEAPATLSINTLSWAVLVTGLLLSGLAGLVYFRTRRNSITPSVRKDPVFEKTEFELILAMCAKPEYAMLTEEVNFMLGTSKKSVEVQKKHRSDVIKSINEKYAAITGDPEKLITQERLESDRRLVRYVIHPDKFSQLSAHRKNGNDKNGDSKKTFSFFIG